MYKKKSIQETYLEMINKILKNNYLKSVQWGLVSIGVVFLNQLVLIPIFLAYFNKEIYGIWVILSTTVLIIRALNLGQLHYTSNILNLNSKDVGTYPYSELLKNGFFSNILMVLFQIILLIIISQPIILKLIFNISIQEVLELNLHWCLILYGIPRILYQFYNLYVLRLFEPLGKINLTIKYQSIGEFFEFASIVLACIMFKDILMMCIFSLITAIIYSIGIHFLALKYKILYFAKVTKDGIKKGLIQIRKSFYLTISFLIEKFTEIGLNYIVIFTYSISVIPLFNTTRVIANAAIKVSNIISIPLMPKIQKNFSEMNHISINNTFNLYWKFTSTIIFIAMLIFIPFIDYFYEIWTRGKIELNKPLFILILIAVLIQNFNVILIEFVKKVNYSKLILLINIIKVSVIVLSFLYFGKQDQILGLGLGVIFIEIISTIILFLKLNKLLDIKSFYSNIISTLLYCSALLAYFFTSDFKILLVIASMIILMKIVWKFSNKIIKQK